MIKLSAFADEISNDLNVQLSVLEAEKIRFIELRSVWGKNVLQLNDDEVATIYLELNKRGFRCSSIGSPIGKIMIEEDFEDHLNDFRKVIKIAKFFNAPYIRVFSFFIPQSKDPQLYRRRVLDRMQRLVKIAEEEGIVLLLENEKEVYGDTPVRCLDILDICNSRFLRSAFDPANFVQCRAKPFTEAYPLLKKYIEYIHIKDANWDSKEVKPAGQGDAQLTELLLELKNLGYSGYISLEPHLFKSGKFSGFSGVDLFKIASRSLKKILDDIGEQWD